MTLKEKMAYDAFMEPYRRYLSGEFYEPPVVDDESDDETGNIPGITMGKRGAMPKVENQHETQGCTRV